MNKNILSSTIVVLFIFLSITSKSQSALAKIKYEEAELAFQKGKYNESLKLLNEVEGIIKSTSPKTLYLKILSIRGGGIDDYNELKLIRGYCKYFLEKYGETEGFEDRYKEVYDISKELDTFPKNESAFDIYLNKKQNDLKIVEEKNAKQKLLEDKYNKLREFPFREQNLSLNMKKEDMPKYLFSYYQYSGIFMQMHYYYRNSIGNKQTGLYSFGIDGEGKLSYLHKYLLRGKKSDVDAAMNKYKELENKLTAIFGREHVTIKDTSYYSHYARANYRMISATLSDYYPYKITIFISIIDPKGILFGTTVDLGETHERRKFAAVKK